MNRLDFLIIREQVMENIDSIVDGFFYEKYNGDVAERDELVTQLCDMVCEVMDPAGMN